MTLVMNKDKVKNILFFNKKVIETNSFKNSKYNYILDNRIDDLLVFPNEEDVKFNYKKNADEIYKEIRKDGKFCEGLFASYIKDSLYTCDAILKIESSMTRSKKMYGFATLKFMKSSKSLYIDTICTNIDIKGTGSYIINLLSNMAEELSLGSIKLNYATKAVPFYLKTNFECDDVCKMIKEINIPKTKKNKKSVNKTRRKKL